MRLFIVLVDSAVVVGMTVHTVCLKAPSSLFLDMSVTRARGQIGIIWNRLIGRVSLLRV